MEVRAGYKRTEVGVIPVEWEVKRFCEIGKLSKGKGLLKQDIKTSGSIPAIPYTALYTDYSEIQVLWSRILGVIEYVEDWQTD
jgi:type I restriction enzyme S subunit